MQTRQDYLKIPIEVAEYHDQVVVAFSDKAEQTLGVSFVAQADTYDQAIEQACDQVKMMNEYRERRSRELDRWKFFQKGNWKKIGGTWFTMFGFHFYFIYGKNMKGGRYIPFTNLNISFNNFWKSKYVEDKFENIK